MQYVYMQYVLYLKTTKHLLYFKISVLASNKNNYDLIGCQCHKSFLVAGDTCQQAESTPR